MTAQPILFESFPFNLQTMSPKRVDSFAILTLFCIFRNIILFQLMNSIGKQKSSSLVSILQQVFESNLCYFYLRSALVFFEYTCIYLNLRDLIMSCVFYSFICLF